MGTIATRAVDWRGAPASALPPPEVVASHAGADQLTRWIGVQASTAIRHAASLRPFKRDEFGSGPASPGDAHVEAANELMRDLRAG